MSASESTCLLRNTEMRKRHRQKSMPSALYKITLHVIIYSIMQESFCLYVYSDSIVTRMRNSKVNDYVSIISTNQ